MSQEKRGSGVNYGITADIVKSDVLAVGPNATAQKTIVNQKYFYELKSAIEELRLALEANKFPVKSRDLIERHIGDIERYAQAPEPSRGKVEVAFKGLTQTLHELNIIVSDATGLLKPIRRIAELFGIALAALGLA